MEIFKNQHVRKKACKKLPKMIIKSFHRYETKELYSETLFSI